jgi:RHS repeat-associated protein
LTYEYDKNGNRTKTGGFFARTGLPHAIASTAYNAANHQTTFGDKTLTYDNNGNVQTITDSGGTATYTWNARNQLVGISGPGVSATFVYDALGRREKKTVNGSLTEFLYDGLNPVQETSGATILSNILPGLGIDEFLTRTDVVAGVTSSFLTDALGSPVAVTDNAGTVQTEYTYEPFGRTTFTGSSNSSSYQYTGRENDGTGLYYYRARYYQSGLQRFISEDPLEYRGGDANLYAYVTNGPTNLVDPSGEFGTIGAGFAGGVVGGAIAGFVSSAITSGVATAMDGGSFSNIASDAFVGGLSGAAVGAVFGGIAGAALGAGMLPSTSLVADAIGLAGRGWLPALQYGVGEGLRASAISRAGTYGGIVGFLLGPPFNSAWGRGRKG